MVEVDIFIKMIYKQLNIIEKNNLYFIDWTRKLTDKDETEYLINVDEINDELINISEIWYKIREEKTNILYFKKSFKYKDGEFKKYIRKEKLKKLKWR
jgi:hypothetical protein